MTIENAQDIMSQVDLVPCSSIDGNALAAALPLIANHLRQTRTGLSMTGIDGAPDWLGFESALWKLSERLRPLIAARKDWREGSPVMDALASIAADRQYGKGRQNMVLMLGDFGGRKAGDLMGSLLDDDEVQGHAIKALIKLKDARHQAKVAEMMLSLTGWMKSAAKKYLSTK